MMKKILRGRIGNQKPHPYNSGDIMQVEMPVTENLWNISKLKARNITFKLEIEQK
jgi:hypothetical protein